MRTRAEYGHTGRSARRLAEEGRASQFKGACTEQKDARGLKVCRALPIYVAKLRVSRPVIASLTCAPTAAPKQNRKPHRTMNLRNIHHLIVVAGVFSLAGCASIFTPPVADGAVNGGATAGTWSWRYRTFDTLSGEEYPAGRAELSGRPGAYNFRLILNRPAPCADGSVPATVAVDDQHTVITAQPRMKGCGVRRFTIRNDGKGGRVDSKSGDSWLPDPHDRGLSRL